MIFCAETNDVRHDDRRLDTWPLFSSNVVGKFERNFGRISGVCVLVCCGHWFHQFCDLLSYGTTAESTQQRFNKMGIAATREYYDFLFEQLSRGFSVDHDFNYILELFSHIDDSIYTRFLVSFDCRLANVQNVCIRTVITFDVLFCRIKRFPPKAKLLTTEEYYEQGVRETTKALEELKSFCSSPESKPWRMMTKLKNPHR